MSNTVVIYGGKGALGSECVSFFKETNYRVISIDLVANEEADGNIIMSPRSSLPDQGQKAEEELKGILDGGKVDAILCVAGGWAGGNAASDELLRNTDLMFKQSVWTSVIAAKLAASFLKPNGLLCLTGAVPSLGGTPGMMGYGMAKAAVHQLVKSLAGKDNGLPDGACALAILPITLDTPMNRKHMKDADTSSWTPLRAVASLFHGWIHGERPASGSLARLITQNSETKVVVE